MIIPPSMMTDSELRRGILALTNPAIRQKHPEDIEEWGEALLLELFDEFNRRFPLLAMKNPSPLSERRALESGCIYPSVDGLPCQFIAVGNWRGDAGH